MYNSKFTLIFIWLVRERGVNIYTGQKKFFFWKNELEKVRKRFFEICVVGAVGTQVDFVVTQTVGHTFSRRYK